MRHRWITSSLLVSALAFLATPVAVQAGTTWYVDIQANASPDGTTWCSAYTGLETALAVAQPGDEIRVAEGTYRPDQGTGDRTATFRLVDRVGVFGGYAGCGAADPDARNVAVYSTVLSGDLNGDDEADFTNYGDNSYHVVTYDDPNATNVVLDGFTISGGNADGTGPGFSNQGGGIQIRSETIHCIPGGPTIRNCVIRDNWAANHGAANNHALASVFENCVFRSNFAGHHAGGLLIQSGSATVRNCSFLYNVTTGDGGGVWALHDDDPSCADPSEPLFENCNFTGNRALHRGGSTGRGGGLFNARNNPTITGCTFRFNEAFFFGGGSYINQANSVVRDCQFIDNFSPGHIDEMGSGNGGGLWIGSTTSQVTNCLFLRNSARSYGGGLTTSGGEGVVSGCLFLENFDTGRGGGIRIGGGFQTIVDCLFDNNQARVKAGGLHLEGTGIANVLNTVFRNNYARQWGGAFSISNGQVSFGNCLMVGNSTDQEGGMAKLTHAALTMVNSTLAFNSSPRASAIWTDSFQQASPSTVDLSNCILWNGGDEIRSNDNSLFTIRHSDVQGGWAGVGNIATDPMFADAAGLDGQIGTYDDNLRLAAGSPCVSAGDAAALMSDLADLDGDGDTFEVLPIDLDEQPRITGLTVDMGAYERSELCPPGWFSVDGHEPCTPCQAGSSQSESGATQCLACPVGMYQPLSQSEQCEPCDAGTYQPATGQTSCLACGCGDGDPCTADSCDVSSGACENEPVVGCGLLCGPGWFSDTGAEVCDRCSPGTYQPNEGATACILCEPGTAQAISAALECRECDVGTYQPDAGQAECIDCLCDDGLVCTLDTCDSLTGGCSFEWMSGCPLPCPPGWHQVPLNDTCAPCSEGTYQPNTGQASCLDCDCHDGNPATLDSCDAVTGTCQYEEIFIGDAVPAIQPWALIATVIMILGIGAVVLRHPVLRL